MTVLHMLDADGKHITTINLYDDVYEHLATEAAINGVNVADHITAVIAGYAEDITNSLENT